MEARAVRKAVRVEAERRARGWPVGVRRVRVPWGDVDGFEDIEVVVFVEAVVEAVEEREMEGGWDDTGVDLPVPLVDPELERLASVEVDFIDPAELAMPVSFPAPSFPPLNVTILTPIPPSALAGMNSVLTSSPVPSLAHREMRAG